MERKSELDHSPRMILSGDIECMDTAWEDVCLTAMDKAKWK